MMREIAFCVFIAIEAGCVAVALWCARNLCPWHPTNRRLDAEVDAARQEWLKSQAELEKALNTWSEHLKAEEAAAKKRLAAVERRTWN